MTPPLRVVFMGTPDFAVPPLQALLDGPDTVVGVVTQPDRPKGRGMKLAPPPVKVVAQEANLPVIQSGRLRDEGVFEQLQAWAPDLIVVVAFGQLLPKNVLDLPRLGCINIHGSLLPRWRGAAPIHRALLAGDAMTGVTTMLMEQGLDTGSMLLKAATEIAPSDTTGSLFLRLADMGAGLLMQTIEGLKTGAIAPEPQDDALATHAAKVTPEDAKIDWCLPAAEIERQIRALQPFPVATTALGDTALKIHQGEVGDACTEQPGQVARIGGSGIEVCCGDGHLLRLTRLQRPGKQAMEAEGFLNGFPIEAGMRLG